MIHSHQMLEHLYLQVLDAMAIEAPDLRDLWTILDHELRAHMDAEERFVIPAFAHVDRDEAVTLLREHGHLRELLLELGVAVDLHAIRYPRSHEFVDRLRTHVAREERLLYRWADQNLGGNATDAAIAFAGAA